MENELAEMEEWVDNSTPKTEEEQECLEIIAKTIKGTQQSPGVTPPPTGDFLAINYQGESSPAAMSAHLLGMGEWIDKKLSLPQMDDEREANAIFARQLKSMQQYHLTLAVPPSPELSTESLSSPQQQQDRPSKASAPSPPPPQQKHDRPVESASSPLPHALRPTAEVASSPPPQQAQDCPTKSVASLLRPQQKQDFLTNLVATQQQKTPLPHFVASPPLPAAMEETPPPQQQSLSEAQVAAMIDAALKRQSTEFATSLKQQTTEFSGIVATSLKEFAGIVSETVKQQTSPAALMGVQQAEIGQMMVATLEQHQAAVSDDTLAKMSEMMTDVLKQHQAAVSDDTLAKMSAMMADVLKQHQETIVASPAATLTVSDDTLAKFAKMVVANLKQEQELVGTSPQLHAAAPSEASNNEEQLPDAKEVRSLLIQLLLDLLDIRFWGSIPDGECTLADLEDINILELVKRVVLVLDDLKKDHSSQAHKEMEEEAAIAQQDGERQGSTASVGKKHAPSLYVSDDVTLNEVLSRLANAFKPGASIRNAEAEFEAEMNQMYSELLAERSARNANRSSRNADVPPAAQRSGMSKDIEDGGGSVTKMTRVLGDNNEKNGDGTTDDFPRNRDKGVMKGVPAPDVSRLPDGDTITGQDFEERSAAANQIPKHAIADGIVYPIREGKTTTSRVELARREEVWKHFDKCGPFGPAHTEQAVHDKVQMTIFKRQQRAPCRYRTDCSTNRKTSVVWEVVQEACGGPWSH